MAAKCAILAGSVTSALVGIVFVRVADALLAARRRR
jgi:Na+/H+ antiporter NhaA